MSLARALCPLMLAVAFLAPAPARSDDVIPEQVMVRKFPSGQFCVLPIAISFTAPATPITITFTAYQWVSDGSQLQWTDQAIDNVSLALSSVVAANFGPPTETANSHNCYIGDPQPTPYFYFDRAVPKVLLELFDSDPAPRGWMGSARTSFVNGRSAPRHPSDPGIDLNDQDSDATGGCMRLGDGLDTPDALATQTASIIVTGLSQGTSYDLGAWWECNFVRFPHDTNYLTVSITTGTTVVARKSWGALKAGYRGAR